MSTHGRLPVRRIAMVAELYLAVFSLAVLIGLGPSGVANALVLCTAKDGTLYAGDTPPRGCVVKSASAEAVPAAEVPRVKRAIAGPDPTADERADQTPLRDQERNAEIDRRRRIRALAMQRVMNRTHVNGRFIEGSVVNGADFPVYGVRICIDRGNYCQLMAPSMLQPGARGTFSFATNLLAVPDWRVMWDVVPSE